MVLLTACRGSIKDKEKVQAAILHRLQSHSGLDLVSLDVNTTAVSFDKNRAYATVAFHPKNDPAVNSGMSLKYTLEERDGQWVVVDVADSQGHGIAGHAPPGGDQLPAGHPSLDPANPPAAAAGNR
jgi:hypothetical protein